MSGNDAEKFRHGPVRAQLASARLTAGAAHAPELRARRLAVLIDLLGMAAAR